MNINRLPDENKKPGNVTEVILDQDDLVAAAKMLLTAKADKDGNDHLKASVVTLGLVSVDFPQSGIKIHLACKLPARDTRPVAVK